MPQAGSRQPAVAEALLGRRRDQSGSVTTRLAYSLSSLTTLTQPVPSAAVAAVAKRRTAA